MVLTIMVLGGVMIGASTIAGLLTLFQIRQSTDMTNSTKAIYAADTGSEWSLYRFSDPEAAGNHPWSGKETIELSNGSDFKTITSLAYEAGTEVAGSKNPRCSCDTDAFAVDDCPQNFEALPGDPVICYNRFRANLLPRSITYNKTIGTMRSFGSSVNVNRAFEVRFSP